MKIVVSRYNEDIEWTEEFTDVVIYNKGEKLECSTEVLLNNVGREGHSYYTYIYENYDSLPDHVIFLQGNAFDHSPNLARNLYYLKNTWSWRPHVTFAFISETIIQCNLSNNDRSLPLADVYEKVFGKKKTELAFDFGAGGQFIVSKEQILKRPKQFYSNIIDLLKYDIDPIEGYVIERFHSLIFE